MRRALSDLEIQASLRELPGWTRDGGAIVKQFTFPRFADGIAFVDRIARVADEVDHHPDIDIRYTRIRIALSTHDAGGITANDIALAKRIEAL
jgi:4a-hydroxytetrahydrobiopterin dehydratase